MFIMPAKNYSVSFTLVAYDTGTFVGYSTTGGYGSATPSSFPIHLSPAIDYFLQNKSTLLISTKAVGNFVNADVKFDVYIDGFLSGTSTRNGVNLDTHQGASGGPALVGGNTYRVEFRNFRSA